MIKTFMRDDNIITISSLIPFHLYPHAFWMSSAPNRFVFLLSCRSHSTYHTSFPAIYYYYVMYLYTSASTTLKARTIHNIILHLYSLRYIILYNIMLPYDLQATWGKRLSQGKVLVHHRRGLRNKVNWYQTPLSV